MLQVLDGDPVYTWEGTRLTLSAPAGMLTFSEAIIAIEPPTEPGMPRTGGPNLGLPFLLFVLALLAIGLGVSSRHRPAVRETVRERRQHEPRQDPLDHHSRY